jgi:hypothetical protein
MSCVQLTVIHLVRYIPEWLPWFSYQPLARYGYDLGQELLRRPMVFVKESMVREVLCLWDDDLRYRVLQSSGTAQPSLALENLQEAEKLSGPEREKAEKAIAEALGSMYGGV